jgi:hypothetical protein
MQTDIRNNPSSFQKMAVRPGGKPRELALRDAAQGLSSRSGMARNLIRTNIEFLNFAGENLGQGGGDLSAAYQKAVETAEVASFLQMAAIAEVASSLSELIFRMIADGRAQADCYVVHIQALKLAFSAGEQGLQGESAALLIARLGKVVGQVPDPDRALRLASAS